ncbi:hypothetical protein DPMN_125995 [Dreissena polymorpha]|uniref:Uncharacterized protein n=1 Tax=Dreissena polymorpha TaxID=45954 RepID=A0A9D4JTJ6_DREPO|nr:hypothetical protein DPMN_125995 [Dreissena polymorpha]
MSDKKTTKQILLAGQTNGHKEGKNGHTNSQHTKRQTQSCVAMATSKKGLLLLSVL